MCDGALGESPELIVFAASAILIKTTVDFRNFFYFLIVPDFCYLIHLLSFVYRDSL